MDYVVQDVLFGHFLNVFAESEFVDDVTDVGREVVDVRLQVLRQVVGVVQQRREVERRHVVESPLCGGEQEGVPDFVGQIHTGFVGRF